MYITSKHVIRAFLAIHLPLSFILSIAAFFDARHIEKIFLNQNFEHGTGIILADDTALKLYKNRVAPYDQKRASKQHFLIGLFVQTESKIDILWCDDWQNTPQQTAITGSKNGIERAKLPIQYFHSCSWLFEQQQLDRHEWTGKTVSYTKNQNDILYSLSVDGQKVLELKQSYALYHELYKSKISTRHAWMIFFVMCICVAIYHFRKTFFTK